MKKLSILLVILISLTAALCSCGNSTKSTSTTAAEEKIDVSIFPEVEPTYENLEVYRKEVSSRLSSLDEGDNFITDEEWEAISNSNELGGSDLYRHTTHITTFNKLYEEISEYYYPVVFRNEDQLILWYTTESGSLIFKKIKGLGFLGGNYGGEVHYDTSDEDEETITSKTDYTVTYAQETGEVKVWKFGELTETFTGIPQGSLYCGFSRFEGYIFRDGTDVYSLKNGSVNCIAHNVKYVIDADYYYGSDPWCQPLFQMTDGSLKAYIGWEGDQDAPDSSTHLCDLQYEGSWDK